MFAVGNETSGIRLPDQVAAGMDGLCAGPQRLREWRIKCACEMHYRARYFRRDIQVT